MGSDFHIVDDTPDEPTPDRADEDRLNLARIRAIALDRRAAHRRRFWARAVVFLFACGGLMTGVDVFRTTGTRRLWFVITCAVFIALAVRAFTRLRRFTIHESTAADPSPVASAFDELSDGSQYAKGLDELTRDRE